MRCLPSLCIFSLPRVPIILITFYFSLNVNLVLFIGARRIGGLDKGEELHPRSSGLWEGPEQCTEVITKTQDSGWRTAGSPVAAAGVCAHVCLSASRRMGTCNTSVSGGCVLNFAYFCTCVH